MRRGRVLIDFDGVLYDYMGAMEVVLPGYRQEGMEDYNFHGDIGVPREQALAMCTDVRTFEALRKYNGVDEALERLSNAVDCIPYTYVPYIPELVHIRAQQIMDCNMFGLPIFIDPKPLQEDVLAVFEDNLDCIDRWIDVPGTSLYLIDQIYNRGYSHPCVTRCFGFPDAVDKFLADLAKTA